MGLDKEAGGMLELFSFEAEVPLHLFEYSLRSYRTEQHWHSFYEIGYCVAGEGVFFIGDSQMAITPGSLLLFPPYERHIAMVSAEEAGCRCVFVYFSDRLFPPEDRHLLHLFDQATAWSGPQLGGSASVIPGLPQLFSAMLAEYERGEPGYGALLRGQMLTLCALLYRSQAARPDGKALRERLHLLDQLKPVLDHLAASFREPVELGDIARLIGLSESRMRHLFKAGTGKRFKEYLTYLRIQEAKRLLATTPHSVTEIVLMCGFQSPAPFYRSFGELVGLNPQQYRSRQSDQNSRF